jgi:hypothetical protein
LEGLKKPLSRLHFRLGAWRVLTERPESRVRSHVFAQMCKNLTLRLKRSGMKWDADPAAG